MIVLDTSVLVYAVGGDHALAEPCRELITAVGAGQVRATTTPEVLQEFAHVRARRRGREDAARLARDYNRLLEPLTTTEATDLERGLDLWLAHPELGAFDAVLVAMAARVGARAIASADRGVSAQQLVAVVSPADSDFVATLRHH